MNRSNAVETVMRRNLEKLGYPTDDIRWSLGYCQGDGASFSGALDIAVLGARLCPEVKSDVWEKSDIDLRIDRTDSHYVHERSTSLSYDQQCLVGHEPHEVGGAAQKVALHKLIGLLESEIVSVGNQNASIGYAVLESYIQDPVRVRTYRTDSFRVEIWKLEDEDANPFEWTEPEHLDDEIKSFVDGKMEVAMSKVVVHLLDDDGDEIAELATSYVGGHVYLKVGPVFGCGMRELVSEAISEARDAYAAMSQPRLKAA